MFFKRWFSRANSKVRAARHRKFKTLRRAKIYRAEKIKFVISRVEREFFWQILSAGFLIFFVASVLPNFAGANGDYFLDATQPFCDENLEKFALTDEGFFLQPAMQTVRGSREKITEIIEVLVEPGDTVSTIAHKYGVSIETIIQNNNLTSPNRLRTGAKLTILPVDGYLHIAEKNDTVAKLAKKYSVDEEKIISQNNLKSEQNLHKNQKIIIPGYISKKTKLIAEGAVSPSAAKKFVAGKEFGGQLFFPCRGKYTQFYHYGHYAVDIAEGMGSPIWAAEKGTVVKAQGGWNGGYGNVVVIKHLNGMRTLYAHLKEIYVDVGQKVTRGQTLGFMGNTGRVYGRTGIHLHFEVIVNGTKKNPIAYF